MKFSLILATFGIDKITHIKELLQSLNEASFKEFEVILVDQNPGNEIELLFFEQSHQFSKKYLKSEPGLSKARNIGLMSAKGEYVAFPDDDCIIGASSELDLLVLVLLFAIITCLFIFAILASSPYSNENEDLSCVWSLFFS